MHMMFADILYLYRPECSQSDMECDLCNMDTLFADRL